MGAKNGKTPVILVASTTVLEFDWKETPGQVVSQINKALAMHGIELQEEPDGDFSDSYYFRVVEKMVDLDRAKGIDLAIGHSQLLTRVLRVAKDNAGEPKRMTEERSKVVAGLLSQIIQRAPMPAAFSAFFKNFKKELRKNK